MSFPLFLPGYRKNASFRNVPSKNSLDSVFRLFQKSFCFWITLTNSPIGMKACSYWEPYNAVRTNLMCNLKKEKRIKGWKIGL